MTTQSPDEPTAPLASGMPILGLGTWQNDDPDQCAETVRTALEMGYRHVDTAKMYGNEDAVGEGIAAANVDPDDVFVATKVWHTDLGYDDAVESARTSREALGVDSIDLLYVHWPAGTYDPEETLGAFADLRDDGVIEQVGVSNFTPELLDEAIAACDAPIFANQVECHPFLQQGALRSACQADDVEVVAYSPLARGNVFGDPVLSEVAEKHGANEAQVSLAWLREKGVAAIPKATDEDHLRDNLTSLELALDRDDVAAIDGIDRDQRVVNPSIAPW